jgi:hypothetical protein
MAFTAACKEQGKATPAISGKATPPLRKRRGTADKYQQQLRLQLLRAICCSHADAEHSAGTSQHPAGATAVNCNR